MAITNGAGNRVYFNYERFLRHQQKGKLNDGDYYYNKNEIDRVTIKDGEIVRTPNWGGGVPTNGWSG